MRVEDLVGRDILVGLTYLDRGRKVLRQEAFHSLIQEADSRVIRIFPSEGGERRWVPYDRWAFRPAPGGRYRLIATGRVVTDPSLLTSWMFTVAQDDEGEDYYEVEPNFAPLTQSRVPPEWELTHSIDAGRIRRTIEEFGDEYIGRSLLLGITYFRADGEIGRQEQLFGTIMTVDFDAGIVVSCEPDGRNFVLPGDPSWVEKAPPAEFRLRSTGKVVKDPDFLATLMIRPPNPGDAG